MKIALLTAAALISVFGLTGCTGPSGSASPAAASPAPTTASTDASSPPSTTAETPSADPAEGPAAGQPEAPAAGPAPSAGSKAHFGGDHAAAGAADSPEIIELARQWHSAEKEALFHEKMDGSGLSAHVPAEQAEAFYGQAAAACQRRFDGHTPPLQGPGLEIENLALSIYCPELG